MPTYDYRCEGCGHELELFQSIREAPKRKCPECGTLRLRRVIGPGAGFLFRGSGFYLTDYRSESYRKAAESEKSSSEPGSKDDGAQPKKEKEKKDQKGAGGGGTSGSSETSAA